MTLEERTSGYVLPDGELISVIMEFAPSSQVRIVLKVRKYTFKKTLVPAVLEFQLRDLTRVDVVDDFETTYYSDITLVQLQTGVFYLSLDPYGNLNKPHEKDNFVFECKSLEIVELPFETTSSHSTD